MLFLVSFWCCVTPQVELVGYSNYNNIRCMFVHVDVFMHRVGSLKHTTVLALVVQIQVLMLSPLKFSSAKFSRLKGCELKQHTHDLPAACAGQQFSKPPGRANATPNPSASPPAATRGGQDAVQLTSMTGQAEDATETPIDDELGQSADAQVAERPSRGGHGQALGVNATTGDTECVVLPQMEDADLQSLQQVSTCCSASALSDC